MERVKKVTLRNPEIAKQVYDLINLQHKLQRGAFRKKRLEVVQIVLSNEGFVTKHFIGKGSYGDVFAAVTPSGKKVAVKIVDLETVSKPELSYWKKLKHENVLRLKNTFYIPILNICLFITPLLKDTLYNFVKSEAFHYDPKALSLLKTWFKNIAKGLEYLHKRGFVHLDLKPNNVLISYQNKAIICDFSTAMKVDKLSSRAIHPAASKPPEVFDFDRGSNIVLGTKVDVWMYGLLLLNVLTDYVHIRIVGNVESWKRDIFPCIYLSLQEPFFTRQLHKLMPRTSLDDLAILSAKMFIRYVLRINPEDRPTAKQIAQHSFFKRRRCTRDLFDSEFITGLSEECISRTTEIPSSHDENSSFFENIKKYLCSDCKEIVNSYIGVENFDDRYTNKTSEYTTSVDTTF